MAGNGSRFTAAGYTDIKPLIPIHDRPMIAHAIESVGVEGNWVFIVQKEHRQKYDIDSVLQNLRPRCTIIDTGGGVTEGAACSILLAEHHIDKEAPLIIINSDNIIKWDVSHYNDMINSEYDGLIPCFKDTASKWSFAKVIDDVVVEVAEKNPISDNATAGLYIWKCGSDFIDSAKRMIEKNIRVNNEFYLCPVYNETISMGKKIKICYVQEMHGVGTPEDLVTFINGYKGDI